MKTNLQQQRPFLKVAAWFCVMIGAVQMLVAADESIKETLQKGLYEEEANHDLGAAMQAYQSVINQAYDQRKLAATAVFRLGECNRKLGKTNEAAQLYTRLLGDFAEQTNLVQSCRVLLAGMGKSATTTQVAGGETPQTSLNAEAEELGRLKTLLKDSPDLINAKDSNGKTPLHLAAAQGQLTVIEFLLNQGADINAKAKYGETSLYLAVQKGHKSTVDFLLSKGADPNAANPSKRTPLYLAADLGFKSVAESLLKAKANPNPKCEEVFENGASQHIEFTPLHIAVYNNFHTLTKLLLDNGADAQDQAVYVYSPGKQVLLRNMIGTPLSAAAYQGNTNIADLLLKHGAGIDIPGTQGWSPLMIAVANRQAGFVQWLLDRGANPNSKAKRTPTIDVLNGNTWSKTTIAEDSTPLHVAMIFNSVAIAQLLLEYKADVNAKDINKSTPLFLALDYSSDSSMFKLLLNAGADPNIQYENGKTLLHDLVNTTRAGIDSSEGLKLLLQAKANTELRSITGNTPLLDAASRSDIKLLELLLDGGADVNATNQAGMTALMYAASRNNPGATTLLLAHKADVNALDLQGKSALDYIQPQPNRGRPLPTRLPGSGPVRPIQAPISAGPIAQDAPTMVINDLDKILRDAGASEDYRRKNRIQASRAIKDENGIANMTKDIFYKQNGGGFNQYTLLEAIANLFGQGPNLNTVFPFPDFANVKVNRLTSKPGEYKTIECNVAKLIESGSSDQDIRLEWGDLVEIPELDHPVNEKWNSLSEIIWQGIEKCLQRTVKLTVKGQTTEILLLPYRFAAPKPPRLLESVPAPAPPVTAPKNLTLHTFTLKGVVFGSDLLRTTSDTSRIKLKRATTDGEPAQEIVCKMSASQESSIDTLILRDGDEIEIPDKE